jgi:hypothetical protein
LVVAVRVVPIERLLGIIARLRNFCFFREWLNERALVDFADLAAALTHGRKRCLSRSFLLYWLMGSGGKPVDIVVGIQRRDDLLFSHAWVERDGIILGDRPESLEEFIPVMRFSHP